MSEATSDAIREGDALHARVRRAIAGEGEPFDPIARALACHQARFSEGYARMCAARGVDPSSSPLGALPAVPTDAFKLARVATFPAALDVAVFRTSGTTVGARGAHPMRTLETYHAAAVAWARSTLFAPFLEAAVAPSIVALAPSAARAPDSSLSRMMAWFVEELGAPGSLFAAVDDLDAVERALEAVAAAPRPALVMGAAFAFVHLLDRLGGRAVPLPGGSRLMQTGGFKGRSRSLEGGRCAASSRGRSACPRARSLASTG